MRCNLYVSDRTGYRVYTFQSVQSRRKFLYARRREAIKRKQQLTWRGTEYLCIYNNAVTYQEFDIRNTANNVRAQAESFFKPRMKGIAL